MTPSWLNDQLSRLPEGYELALHSMLKNKEQEFHIPMVDFSAEIIQKKDVLAWASRSSGVTLKLFDSGRSFHGYGVEPMSKDQWVRFMGFLLLANLPNQPQLIDTRWIGHRLLAGYSTLRWSKNSPYYVGLPTVISGALSD